MIIAYHLDCERDKKLRQAKINHLNRFSYMPARPTVIFRVTRPRNQMETVGNSGASASFTVANRLPAEL